MKTVSELELALDDAREAVRLAAQTVNSLQRELREARQAEAEARKRDAIRAKDKARRDAKKLAERIGVTIELENDFASGPAWFVSHPKLNGADDPCEGDHYCYDWPEILRRVQTYEKALAS